jgi:hypothetical protein
MLANTAQQYEKKDSVSCPSEICPGNKRKSGLTSNLVNMTQQKGNHKITSINAEKLWIKHNIHV